MWPHLPSSILPERGQGGPHMFVARRITLPKAISLQPMLPGKEKGSGLARVAAYPKPPKQHKPSASGLTDRIVGTCFADTLQVPFPAHRAPVVLQQLQQKEDNYRVENPSWRWLLRTFASNGKRHGQTDVCSSRLAIIEMVPGRATFVR